MTPLKIMIVAGEASGDMHGARLVEAIRARRPSARVCGVGGPALAAAGVEILYDAAQLAVVGILEVLGHFSFIRAAMQALERRLREERPQLLILIDYPDFNLILARKAKRLGIPVFYYISPQVWAWRSGRVKTIRRLVDRMAVILPFEQAFYRERGMEVDFVGHPLLDAVRADRSPAEFRRALEIAPDATLVGLLPGSRRREIIAMLPIFLAAARLIKEKRKDALFLLPLAPTVREEELLACGLGESGLPVRVIREERYAMMAACQAVMAASGTVSLELAILDVPMVIAYRVAPLTYFLGRRLIKVQYASLVNLVAGRAVVPELLQDQAQPERIAAALLGLLEDGGQRREMLAGLAEVRARLGGAGASARAAELALQTAAGR